MVTRPLPSSSGGVAALVAALALALASAACTEPAPIEGAACNADHLCPGGFGCAGGACRKLVGGPIVRCKDDSGCPIGRCLLATNFCVQCLEAADCAQSACLPEAYQCGCGKHDDCATNLCNVTTAQCLSCRSDAQCDSGDCDETTGVCRKSGDGPIGPEEDGGRTPR